MCGPNNRQRSVRGRYGAGSNDDRWVPYPAASRHGYRPQTQESQRYRPQQVRSQAQIPHPRIDLTLEKVFANLLSLIDYSSLPQNPPSQNNGPQSRHEILADSLNYIEHLHNMPVSGCARTSLSYFLNKELKRKVPEQYFLNAGVPREQFRVHSFVPSPLSVGQAVTARIKELKLRKEREVNDKARVETAETRSWRSITRARRKQEDLEEGEIVSDGEEDMSVNKADEEHAGKTAESGADNNETAAGDSTGQQQVKRFMDKIEQWIGLWQTGKLRDADWLSMKDCMDLPD